MHYYQFNIADYRKDTAHLSPLEHYIYRQLIDWYYLDEAPIPNQKQLVLRRLCLVIENEEMLSNVLTDFFIETENGWVHERIEREIADYKAKSQARSTSGKKGGRPKKQPETQENKPNKKQLLSKGKPKEKQSESKQKPNQEPLTNNHKPITNLKNNSSPPAGDEPAPVEKSGLDNPPDPEPEPVDPIEHEFDELKAMYPARNGSNPWKAKNGALGAYRARRAEGHAFETIRAGVSRYAAWCAVTGKVGTETVMQAKRFFGPGEEFLNPWAAPCSPGPPGGSPPGSRSTRDRTLQEDLADDSWAHYGGDTPPPNCDWVEQYIEGESH